MKSLCILLSFYLALSSGVDGQNYEFPVDPRLIYPARNSLPYSLLGVGQHQLIGEQNQLIGEQNQLTGGQNQLIGGQNQLIEGQNQLIGGQNQLIGEQNGPPVNYLYNLPLGNQDISSPSTDQLEGAPERLTLDPLQLSDEPRNVNDVYIFTAPEEPEIPETRPLSPPPVHTKIIFIKAPSPPKIRARIIPPKQEKTVVYVLVKKPEDREIDIAPPVTTEPSKPEVFFIHYKARKTTSDSGPVEGYSSDGNSVVRAEEGAFSGSDSPDEDYKK